MSSKVLEQINVQELKWIDYIPLILTTGDSEGRTKLKLLKPVDLCHVIGKSKCQYDFSSFPVVIQACSMYKNMGKEERKKSGDKCHKNNRAGAGDVCGKWGLLLVNTRHRTRALTVLRNNLYLKVRQNLSLNSKSITASIFFQNKHPVQTRTEMLTYSLIVSSFSRGILK